MLDHKGISIMKKKMGQSNNDKISHRMTKIVKKTTGGRHEKK